MIVARFDEVVHAPNRLKICAILSAVDTADFATVRDGLAVSDSVLSKHVALLQNSGYVAVEKRFGDAGRRTSLSLTTAGRRAFDEHVAALREITEGDARARN